RYGPRLHRQDGSSAELQLTTACEFQVGAFVMNPNKGCIRKRRDFEVVLQFVLRNEKDKIDARIQVWVAEPFVMRVRSPVTFRTEIVDRPVRTTKFALWMTPGIRAKKAHPNFFARTECYGYIGARGQRHRYSGAAQKIARLASGAHILESRSDMQTLSPGITSERSDEKSILHLISEPSISSCHKHSVTIAAMHGSTRC